MLKNKRSYSLVSYSPEYKSQIIELEKYLWSRNESMNRDYFEWKYERNPYVRDPLITLAFHEDKLVGIRGMSGAKWEMGNSGETFIAPCAADVVVHPEHRQSGLFREMTTFSLSKLREAGYDYTFNMSAGEVTVMSSLALKWKGIGCLEHVYLTLEKGKLAKRIKRFIWQSPYLGWILQGNPFPAFDRRAKKRGKVSPHVVSEKQPRPREMAGLVKELNSGEGLRHVRDEAYFAWRYQNPFARYRFLYWFDTDKKLQGYMVLQTRTNTSKGSVNIVDWEATREDVLEDLLDAAITWGKFWLLLTWKQAVPEEAKNILEKKGFQIMRKKGILARMHPTVLVRPVDEAMLEKKWLLNGKDIRDLQSWNLRMIYSEGQ